MSRVRACASIVLTLAVACGPSASVTDTDTATTEGTSTSTTSMPTVTSGSADPSSTSSTGSSGDVATTGPSIPCELFADDCGPGSICISKASSETFTTYVCVPNPDGCVPDYPCPPACQTLCELHNVGHCSPDNAATDPLLLHCPSYLACDVWAPDCPDGLKCTPDDLCVPVVRDPAAAGEPCTADPDTCAEGLYCSSIDSDTGMGRCFELCTGSPVTPACSPNTVCIATGNAHMCFPTCDPLAPDCAVSDACVPNPNNFDEFVCVLVVESPEGSELFSPCAYTNACAPGLFCADPQHAVECDPNTTGCCLPFCDLTQPTCPGEGQECVPWYDMDPAPPGLEDVGFCGLP